MDTKNHNKAKTEHIEDVDFESDMESRITNTTTLAGNNDPEALRQKFYADSAFKVLEMSEKLKEKLRNLEAHKIDRVERIENTHQHYGVEIPKDVVESINKIPGLSVEGNKIHINCEVLAWRNMLTISKISDEVGELFSGIFEILNISGKTNSDWFGLLNTRIDSVNKRIDNIERIING